MALTLTLERALKANEENLGEVASEKMLPKIGQKMKKAFSFSTAVQAEDVWLTYWCQWQTSKNSEVEVKEVVFQNKLLIKHLRGKEQPLPDYGSLPQEPPIMV